MNYYILIALLFVSSCATKYIVPGNRFITPETQGDAFHGQFELQQTSANQLTINTSNSSVEDGVIYDEISRMGFLYSNSFYNQFDLFWSHTGSANSMVGGKFQFIGDSRLARTEGHKMSLAAAVGGNEHETDDKSVEFKLGGTEYLLLYGYRINPIVMPYTSLSYATYDFTGKINRSGPLNGLKPDIRTNVLSLSAGLELSFDWFFAKLEATYQTLKTDETKDESRIALGYSLGISW